MAQFFIITPAGNPPGAPSVLHQTGSTTSTISLAWTASTPGSLPISYYAVFRNGLIVGTSVTTVYTDTGLTGATSYTYQVVAVDTSGRASAPSNSILASTSSSGTYTFDHFVSPTGSNSNPGTKTQPWHLSAIVAKAGSYTQLGIIADQGVYNFSTLSPQISWTASGASFGIPVLNAPSGTSLNPIVIAGCNSAGNYVGPSLQAVIDAGVSPPAYGYDAFFFGSGTLPSYGAIIGCVNGAGYCTFDALEIRNGVGHGIEVDPASTMTNINVLNCLVHHIYNYNEGFAGVGSCTGGILTVTSITGGAVNDATHAAPGGNSVGDSVYYNLAGGGNIPSVGHILPYGTSGTTGTGGVGTYAVTNNTTTFTSQNITGSVQNGNNLSGMAIEQITNSNVINCFIYAIQDLNTSLPDNFRSCGIKSFGCSGLNVDTTTIFADSVTHQPCEGIATKDVPCFDINVTRCWVNLGQASTLGGSETHPIGADLATGTGHFANYTNNIFSHPVIAGMPLVGSGTWANIPITWANNTVIITGGANGCGGFERFNAPIGGLNVAHYNNIYYNINGGTPASDGTLYSGADVFNILDYDILPPSASNGQIFFQPVGGGSGSHFKLPAQMAAFQAFMSPSCQPSGAAESHGHIGTPTLTNGSSTLLKATDYQLANASLGKNQGSTNGLATGNPTDCGAFGNGIAIVGCQWKDCF